jgi:hypothetical protein
MEPKVGFLITAYDQKREVRFTHNMFRSKWKRTSESPISIVISGDADREIKFADVRTRVTTLDNMVGKDFNNLVSTSIMKQIRHGMIELEDLERITGKVDYVVHMHGDILLMNENGFFEELDRFAKSLKRIAVDTVGAQCNDYIHFDGLEIMPQLFVVRRDFIDQTDFMKNMTVQGDLETRSTEWTLRGNLTRCVREMQNADLDILPDKTIIDMICHVVAPARDQWALHRHWGGFAHFGNSLHFPAHVRELRNEMALRAYGVDISKW